jgi:hypothetical protein
MMADPSTDGWEGACELDELKGFLKFPFGSKVHISLNVDMRGAFHFARRSLLFFGSGLAHHCLTAITLLLIHKNDLCLWIYGDRIFWAGQGTGGMVTMVTK